MNDQFELMTTTPLTGVEIVNTDLSNLRQDRWVVIVVVAIAVVIALGLIAAWWIACQGKGMYPALDMPSLTEGGSWKLYCKP